MLEEPESISGRSGLQKCGLFGPLEDTIDYVGQFIRIHLREHNKISCSLVSSFAR